MNRNSLLNIALVLMFCSSVVFFGVSERNDEKSLQTAAIRGFEKVVIDAGHGGEDGGAVSRRGVLEKDINLAISEKLELVLNLFGVDTEMTRRDDNSLSTDSYKVLRSRKLEDMKKRVDQILNIPDAILISIHQNSFPSDEKCCGAQVFYSTNNMQSEILAECTQLSLKKGIDNKNNRVEKEADSSIYILDRVKCPAILVECGFLTNEKEERLLMTEVYRKKVAACIAAGFFEYKKKRSEIGYEN